MSKEQLEHMQKNIDIFVCPVCGGSLEIMKSIICTKCKRCYKTRSGIPLMFIPNYIDNTRDAVTDEIRSFYEHTPFPNYENSENLKDLDAKAENGILASMLNEQIPLHARVLEVGCGTGQLTNYLGSLNRALFGVDVSFSSLMLGQTFKEANKLARVGFYQMNLFRPIFKKESFDLVICNGVLHCTSDPFSGFSSISRLVKKKGYILVGLYNKYGRIFTDLRRFIFNIFGDRCRFLDPYLRGNKLGYAKEVAWFRDQYLNPRESKHTIGEVLSWFERENFEFVYGIPNPKVFKSFSAQDEIFTRQDSGNRLEHLLVQIQWIMADREGGLFIMIGKKL